MKLSEMTKDERSLLLFLETCAVDNTGLVYGPHMNDDDREISKRWNESGFIKFGRIAYASIQSFYTPYANWCELSDDAFQLAHEERKARAVRMLTKRNWERTEELGEVSS